LKKNYWKIGSSPKKGLPDPWVSKGGLSQEHKRTKENINF
jgi:hypothetical protein